VPAHVFPFRMTDERMAAFAWHPWADFWRDMKPAYDVFEETHIPPRVSVCNKRYSVQGRTEGGWTPVSQSECPSRRGGSLPLP
jgi:murein L,D-transpeptidase YafK